MYFLKILELTMKGSAPHFVSAPGLLAENASHVTTADGHTPKGQTVQLPPIAVVGLT
jgi:hypothetical protein